MDFGGSFSYKSFSYKKRVCRSHKTHTFSLSIARFQNTYQNTYLVASYFQNTYLVASWIRFCFALYYWVWCLLWDLYIDLESWNSWKEITFSKLKSKDIWKMQEILRKTHTIGCFFSKLHSETSLKEGNMKGNFCGYDTSKNPISWLDNRSLKT